MATTEQLYTALRNADAAGDEASARRIAAMIKESQQPIDDDVPQLDDQGNLIDTYQPPEQPDRTMGDVAQGIYETVYNTGAGALGSPFYIKDAIQGGIKSLVDKGYSAEDAAKFAEESASRFMMETESQTGKDIAKFMSEAFGALPPIMGGAPSVPRYNAPVRAIADKSPEIINKARSAAQGSAKKEVARMINDGEIDPKTVGYSTEGDLLVKNPLENKAKKQGFDEGALAVVKTFTPQEKSIAKQMLSETSKGLRDRSYEGNATDVIGKSIQNRVKDLYKINRQSGKDVNKESKKLRGQPIEFEFIGDDFFTKLNEELRIDFDDNLNPIFRNSPIKANGSAKKAVKDIVNDVKRVYAEGDALSLHDLKGTIDEYVTYGKAGDGVKGKTERQLKQFRSSISDSLNNQFPEYGKANKTYSDTITSLDEVQSLAGKKTNLLDEFTPAKLGKISTRILTNYPSKGELLKSLNNLEQTAIKYGAEYNDRIPKLVMFAEEIEDRFKTAPERSFKGGIQKGAEAAIDSGIPERAALKGISKGIEKFQGVNNDNAFKAMYELLRD